MQTMLCFCDVWEYTCIVIIFIRRVHKLSDRLVFRWWRSLCTGKCTTVFRWCPSGLRSPVCRRFVTSWRSSSRRWSTWPWTGSGRKTATAGCTLKMTCHTRWFSGARIHSGRCQARLRSELGCFQPTVPARPVFHSLSWPVIQNRSLPPIVRKQQYLSQKCPLFWLHT